VYQTEYFTMQFRNYYRLVNISYHLQVQTQTYYFIAVVIIIIIKLECKNLTVHSITDSSKAYYYFT